MSFDVDGLAGPLLNTPKGRQALSHMDELRELAQSEEGHGLFRAVEAAGGRQLYQAAERVKAGDNAAIGDVLRTLLSSDEGRELARRIAEINIKPGKGS